MQTLVQNLGYSLRLMRKNPGLTLTVLLTLALGIGANTAIFTVDYATLLAPLPYPHADQLVMVWSGIRGHRDEVSVADFVEWRRQSKAFRELHAQTGRPFNIATPEQPEYVDARVTTPGLYTMLGNPPFYLGRDFLPEEGTPGNDHEVILTHKFWERLGSNRHVLGTSLRINGEPYTVVGVFAPGLTDRGQGEFAVPLSFTSDELVNHDTHWLTVMGRLKPGVTIRQAQADMDAVTARLAAMYPHTDKGWGASVEPLKNDFIPSDRIMTLWLLLGAVAFVLLIACANVANLLLAKSMSRQREMAIRGALGAKSGAIFTQLLTESLLLAAGGGALGIGVGYAILQGLVSVMPPNTLPSEADLSLNFPILLFTLGAATLAGVLFGCAPAWHASRVDPNEALKEGGRSGIGAGRHRLRRGLVIVEFALTLTLLAGAGLAIHSFWNLTRVDLGVRTDHTLTFYLPVPDSRPTNPEQVVAYYRQILARIASVPRVSHVSAETGTPLEGTDRTSLSIAGQPSYTDRSQRPVVGLQMVTPDYFRTFGIRLVQGRFLTDEDNASSVRVAVVNQDFVDHFLKALDPLQQRVVIQPPLPGGAVPGPPVEWQIVGVVHNVRSRGFREETPEIDLPFWQSPWPSAGIGVRTAGDPAPMLRSIAAAVHTVDPEIALANPRTMEQVRDDVLANDRFTVILFATFAAIALLLATLGIYGVMAFSVAQRSHEIALRMAVGASRRRVLALVLREGGTLACTGFGFGLVGAYFVGRVMQSALFGVGAMDSSAILLVGLVLVIAALVACYLPARRAASVEPMQALRQE